MKLSARFELHLDAPLIFANHVTELHQIVTNVPWETIDMFRGGQSRWPYSYPTAPELRISLFILMK
jgi:hypothetical protein